MFWPENSWTAHGLFNRLKALSNFSMNYLHSPHINPPSFEVCFLLFQIIYFSYLFGTILDINRIHLFTYTTNVKYRRHCRRSQELASSLSPGNTVKKRDGNNRFPSRAWKFLRGLFSKGLPYYHWHFCYFYYYLFSPTSSTTLTAP